MKTLSYLLVLFVTGCITTSDSTVVKVVSKGTGTTCNAALEQAKRVAVENANGSFVSSRQALKDGRYSESLTEHSGGFVEKYTVLDQNSGIPCTITINASVRVQYNTVNEGSSSPIDLSGYQKLVKQQGDVQKAIISTFLKYPPAVSKQSYDTKTNELKFVVTPQPKFIEDAEGILMSQQRPRVFKSGFAGVFSGFGKRREEKFAFYDGYCFLKGKDTLNCYELDKGRQNFGTKILVNGKEHLTHPSTIYAFEITDLNGKFCDEQMCTGRFPIAKPKPVSGVLSTTSSAIDVRLKPWL